MSDDEIIALHRKYATDDAAFELVYTHCKIVAEIALDTVQRNGLDVDQDTLRTACMLHDIGTYTLYVPEIKSFKGDGYQQHALIGAKILEDEGYSTTIVSAVRSHILMGLTAREIKHIGWKLPYIDTVPQTIEAELVCFADRFHSKKPKFNFPEPFMSRLANDLPDQAAKFQKMLGAYGTPDLALLAKKYGHEIS